MLKVTFFALMIFCFSATFTIQPVTSQGLLESIRNGIQNVIRPRQERNRDTRTNHTTASSNTNKVQSPSNAMSSGLPRAIHYPVFIPDASLGSSSWMSGSSRVPLSTESIVPSVDYTTSSSSGWQGTDSPFGMEVYEEDQLMGKLQKEEGDQNKQRQAETKEQRAVTKVTMSALINRSKLFPAHKDSLLKKQRQNTPSSDSLGSRSPVTPAHHTATHSPYGSQEYTSGDERSEPSLPEPSHHTALETIADDGRPRSVMYNSLTSPYGASSETKSYIDHSPVSSASSSSPSHVSAPSQSFVQHHHTPTGTTSPMRGQLYHPRGSSVTDASKKMPYWADATLMRPETTTSSLYPPAAFTTSEVLASAKLL